MSLIQKSAVMALAGLAMASPASADCGRFGGCWPDPGPEPTEVPEPATFGLFGLGLVAGVVAYRMRRKRRDRD